MTTATSPLHWPNVHRAAAAKQRLMNAAEVCNGHKTPEVIQAMERYNRLLGKLTDRERNAVNQLS